VPRPALRDALRAEAALVLLDRDARRVGAMDHPEQVVEAVRRDDCHAAVRLQPDPHAGRGLGPGRHAVGGRVERLDLVAEPLSVPEVHGRLVLGVPGRARPALGESPRDRLVALPGEVAGVEEGEIQVGGRGRRVEAVHLA